MSSSTTLPSTQRALFTTTFPGPTEIKERPVPQEVEDDEIILKIEAAALNPFEVHVPTTTWDFVKFFPRAPSSERPLALGHDFAGTIVRAGKGVTHFKVGDRVLSCGALGADDTQGFQSYAKVSTDFVTKLPDSVSFEAASTIPMGLVTAAAGFYSFGGLTPPWVEGGRGKYKGQACVIGGASGSIGQIAVQLARLNGFSPIIATAAPQHETLLKSLGATHVIPHSTAPADVASLASPSALSVYFITHTSPETIMRAIETLPSGLLITTLPPLLHAVTLPAVAKSGKDIKAIAMMASPYRKEAIEFGKETFAALEGLLASGEIVGNTYEVLDGGLDAVKHGLERVAKGTGGSKLVVHPGEKA